MLYRIAFLFFLIPSLSAQQAPDLPAKIADDLASDAEGLARVRALDAPAYSTVLQQSRFGGYLATLLMGAQAQQNDINAKTYQTILTMMEHGTDTQVGSTPDTKGTTSLAMKGAVPKILGFAVQHGAITQQVNGNTVTFRATPAGVLKALAGVDTKTIFGVPTDINGDPLPTTCDWCNKFSAAISFDISQGNTPGTLTAAKQQVASWSLRAELANRRDAKRRDYITNFQRITGITEYTRRFNDLADALDKSADFPAWRASLVNQVQEEVEKPLDAALKAAEDAKIPALRTVALSQARDKFVQIVSAALVEGQKLSLPAKVASALKEYANALKPVLQQRNDILDYANKGLLVTADWTVTRDPNVPDLSTITGILEDSFGPGRKHDFTVNIAAAFFNSSPKSPVHTFHDFKATAQYDIPLGTFQSYGPFVFSLASRYEFIPNDTLSPGGVTIGTTPTTAALSGNMWVGQAKLTIPVKGSGVKIPFSISAANRSELIKEKDVRANIGVTFDLDAIFAQAGASNAK